VKRTSPCNLWTHHYPAAVAEGKEPLLIIAGIAGG
jgi:hypothetical protein